MTHAVYAYRPRNLKALAALLEYDVLGEDKRWMRYTANLLWIIAAGRKINGESVELFTAQMDEIYKSPWHVQSRETGADIVANLLK